MKSTFFENLKDYAQRAVKTTKDTLGLENLEFDHICYQTKNTEEYKRVLDTLSDETELIAEIPHAGRRISVVRLKDAFDVNGVTIHKIEISEPKPKRTVKKNQFDHFSFMVKDNFEDYIDELRKKEVVISEMKQIGKNKFVKCKCDDSDMEIEIRNARLGENEENQTQKTDTPEEKKDDEKEELKKMVEREKEGKLRALADYQNLQKRLDEEHTNLLEDATVEILKSIIEVLDDFNRAISSVQLDDNEKAGLEMVRDKLAQVLQKYGVKRIECNKGDMFDPELHEAIGTEKASGDVVENSVQQILKDGFVREESGRVIRPVQVIVAKSKTN